MEHARTNSKSPHYKEKCRSGTLTLVATLNIVSLGNFHHRNFLQSSKHAREKADTTYQLIPVFIWQNLHSMFFKGVRVSQFKS